MFKNTKLLQRLAVLEATVAKLGHSGALDDEQPDDAPKRILIADRQVAQRYNVSVRSLERWDRQPKLRFPRAVRINRRRFRVLAELEEWDRTMWRRALGGSAKSRRKKAAAPSEAAP